jgi:hypothetical protein
MNARPLRFLASMPRLAADAENWVKELRRIEDLGFHAVAISEHYSQGWAMEAHTAMNFALATITRLRAMPLVLNNHRHQPALLTKAISTDPPFRMPKSDVQGRPMTAANADSSSGYCWPAYQARSTIALLLYGAQR